jgi:hypothetical protein
MNKNFQNIIQHFEVSVMFKAFIYVDCRFTPIIWSSTIALAACGFTVGA